MLRPAARDETSPGMASACVRGSIWGAGEAFRELRCSKSLKNALMSVCSLERANGSHCAPRHLNDWQSRNVVANLALPWLDGAGASSLKPRHSWTTTAVLREPGAIAAQ